ncbi:hypothetical protein [Lacipirellula sp.]|uniref:hypothetical protein n=1 Tax=Lacipirellula sp. TaxID=2691419 RepID=UPI003D0FA1D0
MNGYNHLHPFSPAEGEQFRAEIAQILAQLPAEQFIALLNDVREAQFNRLSPQFIRACIAVQTVDEGMRRAESL